MKVTIRWKDGATETHKDVKNVVVNILGIYIIDGEGESLYSPESVYAVDTLFT